MFGQVTAELQARFDALRDNMAEAIVASVISIRGDLASGGNRKVDYAV